MNIDPDMELLSGTDPGKALTKALVQNEHVKNLVEECAEDLSSVNSVLKQELADGNPPPAVESALDKSEAVEGKVQEASAKLAVVNQALTSEVRREAALLKTGALQNAILNSANFSSIATDEQGVIQLFNVGAERMLGYTAAEVMNKITPADISDPQEVIARAAALSTELGTTITPGFEALVFKASRGIEDIYELTYFRKDGSRFPAVVSVTALRDDQDAIIGYLLIGTDNTARKQAEEALLKAGALQSAIFNSANFPVSPPTPRASSRSSTLAPSACWATRRPR
jgi:PAS domain-containing protein